MPNAKHALNVIPNGAPELGRVHIRAAGHREIRQIVDGPEFVVQQIADIVVEAIHQRVAVIVPRVVLYAKRARYVLRVAAPLEVLVRERRILNEMTDDRRRLNANGRRGAAAAAAAGVRGVRRGTTGRRECAAVLRTRCARIDDGRQLGGLLFDVLEAIAELRFAAFVLLLGERLHARHQRVDTDLLLDGRRCARRCGTTGQQGVAGGGGRRADLRRR